MARKLEWWTLSLALVGDDGVPSPAQSGRVDRASATEAVDSGSIPGRVKPMTIKKWIKPISGRVDRASATEAVDSGSIPGRVKPKTIKIGIHSFPA